MIRQVIEYSARNRFVVLLAYAVLAAVGIWATLRTPLDAIPDVSDNQVIVYADWPGRAPQLVEDQITYPLASNAPGNAGPQVGPRAVDVRLLARVRHLRRRDGHLLGAHACSGASQLHPEPAAGRRRAAARAGGDGGRPRLLVHRSKSDRHDLGQLRAIQDYYLKLGLQASRRRGGSRLDRWVRQAVPDQSRSDQARARSGSRSTRSPTPFAARTTTSEGGFVEIGEQELHRPWPRIRPRASADLEDIVVGADRNGTPDLPGAARHGAASGATSGAASSTRTAKGEVVGGIIVARYGENARDVIQRVKAQLDVLKAGPSGRRDGPDRVRPLGSDRAGGGDAQGGAHRGRRSSSRSS